MDLDCLPLNTSNVGKLTTYQLRQELIKRDALDIEESRINHRTMLERLIRELVKEEKVKRKSMMVASLHLLFVSIRI